MSCRCDHVGQPRTYATPTPLRSCRSFEVRSASCPILHRFGVKRGLDFDLGWARVQPRGGGGTFSSPCYCLIPKTTVFIVHERHFQGFSFLARSSHWPLCDTRLRV